MHTHKQLQLIIHHKLPKLHNLIYTFCVTFTHSHINSVFYE